MKEYKLNEQQFKFAEAYLLLHNATQSAIQAGYSKKTAYSTGPRLLEHAEIQRFLADRRAEIKEEVNQIFAGKAKEMASELYALATSADSENVRLQAVKDFLDRAGHKPTDKVETKNDTNARIEFGFVDPNIEE